MCVNILAKETEEPIKKPFRLSEFMWSFLNLQKNDSDADTLDWELEDWIRRIQRFESCYVSQFEKDDVKKLLKSNNLKDRVERALLEEAKRKGRAKVFTMGIGSTALASALLSGLFFYLAAKRSGVASAACGSFSGAAGIAALAFYMSFLFKPTIDENTRFSETGEIIECFQELLKESEDAEAIDNA